MITRSWAGARALVAVVALGAVFAQVAPAAQFHSEVEPTSLQVSSTSFHVIKTTAFEFRCEGASFSGTQVGKTAESITLSSSYGFCRAYLFGANVAALINTNGCDHRLYASGSYAIECPAGKSIELVISGCKLTIPAQTVGGISYVNNGKHVDMTWNLSGLSYSHSGFICGPGSGSDGTYTGTATAVGKNSKAEEVKYWWE